MSVRNHVRVLLGAWLGTLAGALFAIPFAVSAGLGEAEGAVLAAIGGVVAIATGCALGIGLALPRDAHPWLVAMTTAIVFALEFSVIRAALPDRDPIEALGSDTWSLLIGGSLLVIPQVVLGAVELAAGLRRRHPRSPAPA